MTRVALLGLGEVGRTLAEDLRALEPALDIAPWDTAFGSPGSPAERNLAQLGLVPAGGAADAVAGAELVVCAVTAARCADAAAAAAAGMAHGPWYVDVNSSAPAHKAEAARVVEAGGGRYVEAALMSPIAPRRLASPFLLGGPHAADFAARCPRWGLTGARVWSSELGRAAATKLCRSVVVKGLEALFTEALVAARGYGVEREVLDSLSNILPEADWEAVASYFISRSVQHGVRRAEEMSEAARTVAEVGVAPLMSRACVQRQEWAAAHPQALTTGDTAGMLDALLAAARADKDAHQEARA